MQVGSLTGLLQKASCEGPGSDLPLPLLGEATLPSDSLVTVPHTRGLQEHPVERWAVGSALPDLGVWGREPRHGFSAQVPLDQGLCAV